MATSALRRPVGHDDHLSLVDHLDELRARLIISAVAIIVAFGICAWQNGRLLDLVNRPLAAQTQKKVREGNGPLGQSFVTQEALRRATNADLRIYAALLRPDSGVSPAVRAQLAAQMPQLRQALSMLPNAPPGNRPITLGVGEPFSATLTVSLWFALLLAMPFVLWQLYSFVLPAFSPSEKRVAVPLLLMIPALFLAGVAFGYFLVLPAAVRFLLTFNTDQFNVLVQARDYYRFAALTLLAMGVVFQVPVGILALTRFGVVKLEKLRGNRRYAIVACAVIALPLPGTDPVSMIIETVMLYVLYEIGIVLSALLARPRVDAADDEDDIDLVAP